MFVVLELMTAGDAMKFLSNPVYFVVRAVGCNTRSDLEEFSVGVCVWILPLDMMERSLILDISESGA